MNIPADRLRHRRRCFTLTFEEHSERSLFERYRCCNSI